MTDYLGLLGKASLRKPGPIDENLLMYMYEITPKGTELLSD
jgi:hypothetical protein